MPITHPEQEEDFQLIFNNEKVQISKCLFGLYSKAFRQHPSFIFNQSLDMSEKEISLSIFIEFVKACQGLFYDININNCYGLLELCEKWEVDTIKKEVTNFITNIDDSSSQILKLQFYLNNNYIDKSQLINQKSDTKKENKKDKRIEIISSIEESISKHINSYLGNKFLASLPISSLFRIISTSFSRNKAESLKSKSTESNESNSSQQISNNDDYDIIDKHLFLKFLEYVSNHHKEASRVLIKLIDDYSEFTQSELKNIKEVANPFIKCHLSKDTTTFFNNLNNQNERIDQFQNEIFAIKKEGEQIIKKIQGEVKTLKNSMKQNAKNQPSTSKSFTSLSSIANSPTNHDKKGPIMSNSTSNLELTSKINENKNFTDSEVDQNSVLITPPNTPNHQKHHNMHTSIPVPPHHNINSLISQRSNFSIVQYLDYLINRFNQMKMSNFDVSQELKDYETKFDEFNQRYLEISQQLTEEQAKARERGKMKEIEEKKQEQENQKLNNDQKNQLSQINTSDSKPKSFSIGSKQSEKNASKTSKFSFSVKSKGKDKSSTSKGGPRIVHTSNSSKNNNNNNENKNEVFNNNNNNNEINTVSIPMTNFQTVKAKNKWKSFSEKEPDAKTRVSFSEKHHFRARKANTNLPQIEEVKDTLTIDNSGQGLITVLTNEDENSFEGLIYYLRCLNTTRDLSGNLAIQSSSNRMAIAQPENVLKSENIWTTEDKENQWILFDFISRKINLMNYRIKSIPYKSNSFHMKNWVVEGNNEISEENEESWVMIDKRENNSELNKTSAIATFNVSFKNDKFFRFLRIRMIGPNHSNTNLFAFSQIEFFGTMKLGGDL